MNFINWCIIVIRLKHRKIQSTDKNFGIYNYIDNIIKDLMKELNIKEKQTIGNNEIYSKILLLSMVKWQTLYFIVVTNEDYTFMNGKSLIKWIMENLKSINFYCNKFN